MMRKRSNKLRGFHSGDNYAALALGVRMPVGSSMADAAIYNAKELFAFHVMPDVDDACLAIDGTDVGVATLISNTLLRSRSRDKLWMQPTLPMEIHSWVTGLIDYGDIYHHFVFERKDDHSPWMLEGIGWLAPETIIVSGRGAITEYEQYVSARRFEGADVLVAGEMRDHLETFRDQEILHFRWPLVEPSATVAPAIAARNASRSIDRHAARMLLNFRAAAEPSELFLSFARARAGAYRNAIEMERLQNAIAGDRLFLPTEDDVTEYFFVDRLVRSRVAAASVRDYLVAEFNRQLLERWCRINNWPSVRLRLRRGFWTESEWRTLGQQYREGIATLDDVVAAARVESEHLKFD